MWCCVVACVSVKCVSLDIGLALIMSCGVCGQPDPKARCVQRTAATSTAAAPIDVPLVSPPPAAAPAPRIPSEEEALIDKGNHTF